ncbi:MAG: hypothetical protein M3Y71_15130 [Actinomycetota bacterium]|nr:hypothetical protein [Actinomycetota bacterium]
MSVAASEISGLVESYGRARAVIDSLADPVEREVGLASLRLEATATMKQMRTTGAGVTDPALIQLVDYVGSLEGGERAEKAVGYLDAQAQKAMQKALSIVGQAALSGSLVLGAGVSVVLGWAVTFTDVLQQVGSAAFATLVGGGSVGVALFRGLVSTSQAAGEATTRGWAWAESVGVPSDIALKDARERQGRCWAGAGGRPTAPTPFSSRARSRAQVIVGGLLAVAGVGLLFVLYGAYEAYSVWSEQFAY